MRCPEFDLERIKPLLSVAAWRAEGRDDARRMALAAALAWYCGAKVMEMARLTLGHVVLGDEPAVLLGPPGSEEGKAASGQSCRVVPLLPPVAALVSARLAERPDAPEDTLLLGGGPDWATSGRGVMESCGGILSKISGGRIGSLAALVVRYRRYVQSDRRADPAVVGWLAGTPRVGAVGGEPPIGRKRRHLATVHPLPAVGAWMDLG